MKRFFASCFGVMAALILFFAGLIYVGTLMVKFESEPEITDNTVLHLKMQGQILEHKVDDPLAELAEFDTPGMGLRMLKKAIGNAKDDSRIEGIYINLEGMAAGSAIVEELRQSLLEFKASEKWIVAYGTSLSLKSYYLATVADSIYLHPEGGVTFNGMSARVLFMKKMFDKLKIKPEIFRVGEYKGAVEPFMRENLSKENRTQITELLQSLQGDVMDKIAQARGITLKKLLAISDSAKVQSANDALAYGLVDALTYEDQVKDDLRKRLFGTEEDNTDKKIERIGASAYSRKKITKPVLDDKIAVIVVEGEIKQGETDINTGMVGAATIVKAVRKARKAEEVKAIVMRINSPGGSFIASDNMWRAIKIAAGEKPVIASMSNYAASGGYYLAAACDIIVAQPTTITGSIGVFSLFFDAHEFLEDKIGITSEEVKTGQLGAASPMQPLSPMAKAIWQTRTDSIYKTFVGKVAAGRAKMNEQDVRQVASGRVWSGRQAKENGLVDVLGNYEDALEIAAEKAGIADYSVSYYPKDMGTVEKILSKLQENARLKVAQNRWGAWHPAYRQWQRIKLRAGVQARMPFEFIEEEGAVAPW